MDTAPVIHCFAARPIAHGCGSVRGIPIVVDLETAAWLKGEGWIICGPDPADLQAYSHWQREQPKALRVEGG